MKNLISREIRLKSRPVGIPKKSDFELAEVTVPQIGGNQLLVRNLYMSVDPYMRGRMIDRKSYVPPFQVGQVLEGGSVGEGPGIQPRPHSSRVILSSTFWDGVNILCPTVRA